MPTGNKHFFGGMIYNDHAYDNMATGVARVLIHVCVFCYNAYYGQLKVCAESNGILWSPNGEANEGIWNCVSPLAWQ